MSRSSSINRTRFIDTLPCFAVGRLVPVTNALYYIGA
jgi:hypothetical protein